ncbi:hypothetical protein HanRHA438_Chr04g0174151 [Helianthus annuus]|nr:hypothetical protein HanRHA438_Chr04g0174151 [Helianthus annuus]
MCRAHRSSGGHRRHRTSPPPSAVRRWKWYSCVLSLPRWVLSLLEFFDFSAAWSFNQEKGRCRVV